jgi:paraquat-inducible protein A
VIRGVDLQLASCHSCDLVIRMRGATRDASAACPRCGAAVQFRKRGAGSHVLALVVAAAALYYPANALTIMYTEQFPERRADTILSGVKFLWDRGSLALAAIVFTASILLPVVKLGALGFLVLSTTRHSPWRPRARTRLYRALETIGHWSMLDVFVVALLTAVVQLGQFARVSPGPAVLPFAGVVILTMLASASFDARAIWDGESCPEPQRSGRGVYE